MFQEGVALTLNLMGFEVFGEVRVDLYQRLARVLLDVENHRRVFG